MKMTRSAKFKLGVWFFIVLCIGLFMLQNQEFFKQKNKYQVNLIAIKSFEEAGYNAFKVYSSPELANALVFFCIFLLGVGVSYLLGFFGWVRSIRTIKSLTNDCDRLHDKVNQLESELKLLKERKSEFERPQGELENNDSSDQSQD